MAIRDMLLVTLEKISGRRGMERTDEDGDPLFHLPKTLGELGSVRLGGCWRGCF